MLEPRVHILCVEPPSGRAECVCRAVRHSIAYIYTYTHYSLSLSLAGFCLPRWRELIYIYKACLQRVAENDKVQVQSVLFARRRKYDTSDLCVCVCLVLICNCTTSPCVILRVCVYTFDFDFDAGLARARQVYYDNVEITIIISIQDQESVLSSLFSFLAWKKVMQQARNFRIYEFDKF